LRTALRRISRRYAIIVMALKRLKPDWRARTPTPHSTAISAAEIGREALAQMSATRPGGTRPSYGNRTFVGAAPSRP
jgi:hypothetical protein